MPTPYARLVQVEQGAALHNANVLYTVFRHAAPQRITGRVSGASFVREWAGPMPAVSGALPGTLTAAAGGQSVGTMTRSADGATTSTGLGSLLGALQWESFPSVNADGKTFALFLLPAQPPGFFSYDAVGTQRYADLCGQAGLRTVTSGDPQYFPHSAGCSPASPTFQTACAQPALPDSTVGLCATLNCFPAAANMDHDVAAWVHGNTGWDNLVTHEVGVAPAKVANYHGGRTTTSEWAAPLRPVCGLEQGEVVMDPPGALSHGRRSRFHVTLFVSSGETLLNYTGTHENDSTARG